MTGRDVRLRDADAGGAASGSESVGSGVDRVDACCDAGAGCGPDACVNHHEWPHQPNAMPMARHTMAKTLPMAMAMLLHTMAMATSIDRPSETMAQCKCLVVLSTLERKG